MGSPLASVLANLFVGHHEKTTCTHLNSSALFYTCYVDVFDNENEA